jgi:hypothetical protein
MIIVYQYDQGADRVGIVTIQDGYGNDVLPCDT